ncbi:MAG: hypothetical protein WAS25_15215 [Geothrix sp.]|uniref:hypothetical protein n=1 Tax=Geothrix sp. TaxID=1962974 RepID=UPI003BB0C91F
MLSRSGLWQRLSGAPLWPLAWDLAAACAVPWLLPERWDGRLTSGWVLAGALIWLTSLPLARTRRWAVVPLVLALAGFTALGLARKAQWETALPTGFQSLEGRISTPWTRQGARRGGPQRALARPGLRPAGRQHGLRNRFERPHPETLATMRRQGLTPWVTGPACGIRVAVVDGGWRIETGDGSSAFTPLRKTLSP